MTGDRYTSISAPCEGLYKDRGSRFLCFAYPVDSLDQIKDILDAMKKKYHDARHVCFAYRLGADGSVFRSSDDGEPSGTAGRPILSEIDSAGVSDVLVVVVRYFGGILLGTPGLVKAYRGAASDALSKAEKTVKTKCTLLELSFDYLEMNSVMKAVKDSSASILGQQTDSCCHLKLSIPESEAPALLSRLEGHIHTN